MKNLFLTLTATWLLTPLVAHAVDPLGAKTLANYCQQYKQSPGSVLSQKCIAYVGGFLDGAIATDSRVAQNVVDEIEKSVSFSERAFRTRVNSRLREEGPSVYAEFCVGQPVPIEEVVLHVVEALESRAALAEVGAQNIVYAALRKHYACK